MSYCREIGKDQIIFVTKEDHEKPSTVILAEDPDSEPRGLILEDGTINWDCPCLGGMASGPCGVEFREAFSCFHYSQNEQKGTECLEQFHNMQKCMSEYPTLYPKSDREKNFDDEDDFEIEDEPPVNPSEEPIEKNLQTENPKS